MRAQISQIEKYQQAVNTFRGKYGYLPGDIPEPDASQFGFAGRGIYSGTGDGNGLLQGITASNSSTGFPYATGEFDLFWVDLSSSKLINGGFSAAAASSIPTTSNTGTSLYLPSAKMGSSGYGAAPYVYLTSFQGINYFASNGVINIVNGAVNGGAPSITVNQANAIDSKIDGGLPGTGGVLAAFYATGIWFLWADGMNNINGVTLPTTAYAGSRTSCSDNANTNGRARTYSITQNNGTGVNCGLIFKFQ